MVPSAHALTLHGPFSAQELGRLLMIGFRGETLTEEVREARVDFHIGGLLIFQKDYLTHESRNILDLTQITQLLGAIQSVDPAPIWIAVDGEGGYINRFHSFTEAPPLTTAKRFHALSPEEQTQQVTRYADFLRHLGLSMNLGPCVDLSVSGNPIIERYERAYSAIPEEIIEDAGRWIDAHEAAGLITVLKHFPGHGEAFVDSHHAIPDITSTLHPDRAILPFTTLSQRFPKTWIMPGHLLYAPCDPERPISLSPCLKHWLRTELGYSGVIISDDLQMLQQSFPERSIESLVIEALRAGHDMVIIGQQLAYEPHLVPRLVQAIDLALIKKELSEHEIRASLKRLAQAHAA